MKVLVTLGHRFYRYNGKIYSEGTLCYTPFFSEYLNVFDRVEVISRVVDCDKIEKKWQPAEGPRVNIRPVKNYDGLIGFCFKLGHILSECRKAVRENDVVIIRLPGELGTICGLWAKFYRKKYATTLVGFGQVEHSPWNWKNFAVKFVSWWYEFIMSKQVKGAVACSYVSPDLVVTYPPRKGVNSWFFSTVQIEQENLGKVKTSLPKNRDWEFISVANLISDKGNQYILDALGRIDKERHKNWSLTILGEGPERAALTEQAKMLGITEKVYMPGYVGSRAELFSYLDNSDLFIFASLAEGMPRVVIEACARGLPVVTTKVGGVSNLIDPKYIVNIKDSTGLANTIIRIINNEQAYLMASRMNLENVKRYIGSVLLEQKIAFMNAIKQAYLEGKRS